MNQHIITKKLWQTVVENPSLHDLPYKIELNERGQLLMSPVTKRHTFLQYLIAKHLEELITGGYALQEVSILTDKGVRVADVAWALEAHFHSEPDDVFTQAPSICVEVWSSSNTVQEFLEKRGLYFAAGAKEVWECDQNGKMQFFNADGELEQSELVQDFPRVISTAFN
jgi:Uma2 family endonuclease